MVKPTSSVTPLPEELQFPVDWCFRAVVASSSEGFPGKLDAVLERSGYQERFQSGNASAGGKYRSYHAKLRIDSLAEMRTLGDELSGVEGVKFLL